MTILRKILFLLLSSYVFFPAEAEHYQSINKGRILFYNILSEERSEMEVSFRGTSWDAVSNEYAETITVPETVEKAGKTYSVVSVSDDAFRDCKTLKKVVLPASVRKVGSRAFKDCVSLTSVSFPSSLDSLHESVFDGCRSLASVTLPDGLRSIEPFAFRGCVYLERLELPRNLTSFHPSCVDNCSALKTISVDSLNDDYSDLEGLLYNKQKTALVRCPEGKTEVSLPSNLQGLGEYSMRGCTLLTDLYLPRIFYAGNYAFRGCTGLRSITIPSSLSYVSEGMLLGCTSLDSVMLSKFTVSVRDKAFENCNGLRFVDAPALIEIGRAAFRNCSALSSFSFPSSLKTIGDEAFSGCINLLFLNVATKTPAMCGEGVFDPRITYKAALTVPAGTLPDYRKAAGWQAIYNIR